MTQSIFYISFESTGARFSLQEQVNSLSRGILKINVVFFQYIGSNSSYCCLN